MALFHLHFTIERSGYRWSKDEFALPISALVALREMGSSSTRVSDLLLPVVTDGDDLHTTNSERRPNALHARWHPERQRDHQKL